MPGFVRVGYIHGGSRQNQPKGLLQRRGRAQERRIPLVQPVTRHRGGDALTVEPLEAHGQLDRHSAHFFFEHEVREVNAPVLGTAAQELTRVLTEAASSTHAEDMELFVGAGTLIVVDRVLLRVDGRGGGGRGDGEIRL